MSSATAEKTAFGCLPKRVASRRQYWKCPNKILIRLLRLLARSSDCTGVLSTLREQMRGFVVQPFHRSPECRASAPDCEGPHARRRHRQGLEGGAARGQGKLDPPDIGTEHLAVTVDVAYGLPIRVCAMIACSITSECVIGADVLNAGFLFLA